MFPSRFFAPHFFAGRFFPHVGATPTPPAPGGSRRFLVNNGEIDMTGQGEGTVGYEVLLAQTTGLGPTTVYTILTDGLYRINVSAETSSAGATGTLDVSINWPGFTKNFINALDLTSADSQGYSQMTNLVTADTIEYTTVITAGTGGPEYSLYITIEKIWSAG